MPDGEPTITTETDGENYADVRVDGGRVASVDVVDDDQVKVSVHDPEYPEESQELWFIDRIDVEEDEADA